MKPSRNTTVTSGPVNGTPSGVSRTNATTASRPARTTVRLTYAPTRVRPACALDVSRSACHGSSWLVSHAQPRSPSWRRKNRRNPASTRTVPTLTASPTIACRSVSASSRIADSTRSKAAITQSGTPAAASASPRSVRPLVTRSISSRRYGRNAPIISATTTTRPSRPATHAAADARDRDMPRRRRRSTVGTRGAATTSARMIPIVTSARMPAMRAMTRPRALVTSTRQPIAAIRSSQTGTAGREAEGGAAVTSLADAPPSGSWRQMGVSPPSPSS